MQNKWRNLLIVVLLVAAVAAAVALKNQKPAQPAAHPPAEAHSAADHAADASEQSVALPRLLELGSTSCIPCKMMEPILEELRKEYKGRLIVDFIDVWENREASSQYGVQAIPTQVFYDKDGKEIFRHEGFFPKDEILKAFREKGVEL
jgi:thioredoxin 1